MFTCTSGKAHLVRLFYGHSVDRTESYSFKEKKVSNIIAWMAVCLQAMCCMKETGVQKQAVEKLGLCGEKLKGLCLGFIFVNGPRLQLYPDLLHHCLVPSVCWSLPSRCSSNLTGLLSILSVRYIFHHLSFVLFTALAHLQFCRQCS